MKKIMSFRMPEKTCHWGDTLPGKDMVWKTLCGQEIILPIVVEKGDVNCPRCQAETSVEKEK